MSRTPNVQKEIEGHIARINHLFDTNPNNSNYGQIQSPYNQQWFECLTHDYPGYLPLITYMKQNNTKPFLMERDACLKEIYLIFLLYCNPLDMALANQILDTIFK